MKFFKKQPPKVEQPISIKLYAISTYAQPVLVHQYQNRVEINTAGLWLRTAVQQIGNEVNFTNSYLVAANEPDMQAQFDRMLFKYQIEMGIFKVSASIPKHLQELGINPEIWKAKMYECNLWNGKKDLQTLQITFAQCTSVIDQVLKSVKK